MSFSIKIEGLDDVLKKVGKMDDVAIDIVDKQFGDAAEQMAQSAKQLAPKFDGGLIRGITARKIKDGEWEIISAAPYSAYVEFGTKKKYEAVKGYEELANAAKGGTGGKFIDLYHAILKWVKKKGLVTGRQKGSTKADRQAVAAWNIAISIAKNGIPATHFFTRAIEGVKPRLLRNLKAAFK